MKEEILNALLHLKSETLIIAKTTGEILHSTDSVEALLGYTPSQLAGMRIEELIPDFHPTFPVSQAYSEDLKSSGGTDSMDLFRQLMAFRKGQIPHLVKVGVIHVKLESKFYSLLILKDAHKDKTVGKNLQKQKRILQIYFDLIPAILLTLDPKGVVTSINNFGAKILGRSKEEIVGKNWFDSFIPSHIRASLREYFNQLVDGVDVATSSENDIVVHSNKINTISWRNVVLRDSHQKATSILSAGIDVTDRLNYAHLLEVSNEQIKAINDQLEERINKRTSLLEQALSDLRKSNQQLHREIDERQLVQAELTKNLKLLKLIAHHFPQGIIAVLDSTLKCVFLDGQELGNLGLSTIDCHEQKVFEGKLAIFTEPIKAVLQEMALDTIQCKEVVIDKKTFDIKAVPLPNHEENKHEVLVIIENITEQKKVESELVRMLQKEKELNEMKSKFVTVASHEFRTPLSVISSAAYLLENYTGEDFEREKSVYTKKITQQVKSLIAILNDFMMLEKTEKGKIKLKYSEINLDTFLNDLVKETEILKKPDQRVKVITDGSVGSLIIDTTLFKAIVSNLLINAMKYSHADGLIVIKIQGTEKSVRLEVADQGIGIPLEDQAYIFKRFYRAHNAANIEGTGIGLNLVKKYVKYLGGSIHFNSTPDAGTTFRVTLPRLSVEEYVFSYDTKHKHFHT